MKPAREWTLNDVLALPVGEFDWLEVKGRTGLDLTHERVKLADVRERLSVALSAFANTGGGTVVFGMGDPRDGWQVDDGGVSLTMKRPSTREWLENVIPNLVEPPLARFNVYAITDASLAPDRGIVVVEIGDSEQAPHQASDNRYYGRVAGTSRPLGHRLVGDIFNRRRTPLIDLAFVIEQHCSRHNGQIISENYYLTAFATNNGRVFAQYVNAKIEIPTLVDPERDWDDEVSREGDTATWDVWNSRRDIVGHQQGGMFSSPQYGTTWFEPILPMLSHEWDFPLPESIDHIPPETTINWRVVADNAPMRTGSAQWKDIPRATTYSDRDL